MKIKIAGIGALVFVCMALSAQVKFMDQPAWSDVVAKAKAEHKFIFVDGYTAWCHWCKIMDKTTFIDSVVGAYMNGNFVSAKMNMEKGVGADLAMKFGVTSFPTYLVFSEEGRYIDCLFGFYDSVKFVKELSKLKAMPEAEYPAGIAKQIDLPFPDFYRRRFVRDSAQQRYYPDSATNAAYLATQKDLTNEVTWNVLRLSGAALKSYTDWILANGRQLTRLFGKSEADNMLGYAVNFKFMAVSARGDEAALEGEILPMTDRYMTDTKNRQKPFFKMRFYHDQKNYSKYLLAIKEYNEVIKTGDGNPELVNMACWDLYQECDDEGTLAGASEIMKDFTSTQTEWAYLVTCASLRYKLKDYNEAEVLCNRGIEKGLKANENVEELQKLLEKVKLARGH